MIAPPIHFPRPSEDIERYLSDLNSIPELRGEELEAAFTGVVAGDMEAREKVALAYLRLVVRIAYQYTGYGLPLADMIAEGNIGLLRAVELYDTRFGTAFETYASVWIKQRIHRAITSQSRSVRIPIWRSQRLRKLDRLHSELNSELGRDATLEELAGRLGISSESLSAITNDRTSVDSLDQTDADGDGALRLMLVDDSLLPDMQLSHEERLEEIYACLDELDDTELQVLSLKFGLFEQEPASYREMAGRFGKNREWIRTTGERALRKLKDSVHKVTSIPRKMVAERRQKALARIEKIKKSPAALSLQRSVLIPFMENLLYVI